MTAFTIATLADLAHARIVRGAASVTLETARFKTRGLMPLALKYALFATAPGGRIVIRDDSDSVIAGSFEVSHGQVRCWTFQFIGHDTRLVSLEPSGSITLERTAPVLAPGWSAGVVFSGRDTEIPTLHRCLDGLIAQPELGAGRGEIVVCGPARDLAFLAAYPAVTYLPYEDAPGPRIMIAAKKNALIRHLRGPRVVILHARVVLGAGALAAVPTEFDISGPNVRHGSGDHPTSYLSLASTEDVWPGRMARSHTMLMRHVGDDPIKLHERGNLFVDGGAFYVTKAAHERCPLNDLIAWNEAEDIEWCARAFTAGLLIDIAPDSLALSQTSKIREVPQLGAASQPIVNAIATYRDARNRIKHLAGASRRR